MIFQRRLLSFEILYQFLDFNPQGGTPKTLEHFFLEFKSNFMIFGPTTKSRTQKAENSKGRNFKRPKFQKAELFKKPKNS